MNSESDVFIVIWSSVFLPQTIFSCFYQSMLLYASLQSYLM